MTLLRTRSPISEKQLAANRANALKSKGPNGSTKRSGSPDDITHPGSLANMICLKNESNPRFLRLVESLTAEFQPETFTESDLIATMAVAKWRIFRLWTVDTVRIDVARQNQVDLHPGVNSPTLAMWALRSLRAKGRQGDAESAEENRLDRQFHRALDRLMKIRAERRKEKISPAEAAILQKTKEDGHETDPISSH